ncbi:NADPH-dependent FMN reductase [Taibaiella sp. KBW10]|uniref:NADPH-dependent FMN reductase n=1 Tax=Taibaiella sp. KBW10 TaxID=2153357 RepID=UPI000F5B309F|nr:NAD(P)H-dependent oxidoreductase [Taibaiella sp. KBW10]RQO32242.1 NADPH-dependent FMN reductase [Taibaiella sp. KBW10]
MPKKILAFAGSNSSTSINKQLTQFALSYFEGAEINLLDLNDFEMPLFSVDREQKEGYPEQAHSFLEAIGAADIIICSLAEHNRSYTTAFKNIFDWCSRIEVKLFQDKPMLLMSTSPGGYGGGNVMHTASTFFPQFAAQVLETFSLPSFNKNFANGTITDEALKTALEEKITAFKQQIAAMK